MRRFLLISALVGWILSGARASAGISDNGDTPAILTIGNAVFTEAGTASISLLLEPGSWPVVALQFDLQFQKRAPSVSEALGTAAAGAGKSLGVSTPLAGTKRILIAGPNAAPISAGIVATLTIQVPAGAASVTDYLPLILNATASEGTGFFVAVEVRNSGQTPAVLAVVNAASYAAGAVAPGEMVVIWGSFLGGSTVTPLRLDPTGFVATSLGGTRVLFDGTPGPLVYTSQNQISAIVPYAVDGHSQAAIQVEYQGVRSTPFVAAVTKSAPGLFTRDGSGRGQGAILNQDETVNSPANPAARGSIVSVYGTGAGQSIPPCADGNILSSSESRLTLSPVTATVGDRSAEVTFAGSTGGQICSLLQVNLRVPLSTAPSTNAFVQITAGAGSQPGVTMAVQ